MKGSLERIRWISSEVYEAMQRYQSAQAHVFQPFQTLLQEHVGSIGVPNFFQSSHETHIHLPHPLIMDMCTSNLKREAMKDIRDEDI